MSSPAPKSPEQNEKSKKYDRQLRLWGDHGQKLLENAKVCLINATALGTEILKSLVLPGVGSFTIVDGEKIVDEDIGSNFFLESDSVGMSRAQIATQCLLELNQDVRGDYIDESPDHIMAHSQDFFDSFTVVIATCLSEKVLTPLSKHLWEKNVPLIVCRSVGFVGYIRLQLKEHTVIEAHPDNETPDLRLLNPWPALEQYLDKFDVANLDQKERSHTPAVVILYYYLKKFKEKYGHYPETRAEKNQLREMISDSPIPDEHGIKHLEENFNEAIRFINTCSNSNNLPNNIQTILDDDCCINLNQNSSPFWIMCAALKELIETEGTLPVRGSLPDMAADTQSYLTLQQLYQKQAQQHAEIVYRRAVQIARNLNLPQDIITENDVKLFCKHSSELYIVRGSCIADEITQQNRLDLSSYFDDSDSLIFYYIILKGLERFISEFNTLPGQLDDHVEPDLLKLKNIIGKILTEWGCNQVIRDERVHEICRYGGAEIHSVSAILGGCAAHETIKLITHQYKPINNTFIYDAITSTSATFTL